MPKSTLSLSPPSPAEAEAKKNLFALVQEAVPSPATPGFFLSNLCTKSKSPAEDEKFRTYLKQLKEECMLRLYGKLYNPDYGTMDLKFWLAFSKKKFLKGLSM